MNAVDSSLVIAAFASWHPAHDAALDVLDGHARLPAHAGLEVFSVLTRLPPPHRAAPADVGAFLANEFEDDWLALAGDAVAKLLGELVDRGIAGGATYDGLIGATARASGATLYTCDRRARSVYEQLGVEVRFVG